MANLQTRLQQYDEAVAKARELFERKNREYGDAIRWGGAAGAAIEFIGIAGRVKKVVLDGEHLSAEQREEILRDKFIDAINYGAIGLLMLEERNYSGEPVTDEQELLGWVKGLLERNIASQLEGVNLNEQT